MNPNYVLKMNKVLLLDKAALYFCVLNLPLGKNIVQVQDKQNISLYY